MTLRSIQSESVSKMIKNEDWKVLVYDFACRDIISSLLRVSDLREMGVTLHLPIKSNRSAVPDAPVLYFVEPTEENIQLIVKDMTNKLYDGFSLHFSSALSRNLL